MKVRNRGILCVCKSQRNFGIDGGNYDMAKFDLKKKRMSEFPTGSVNMSVAPKTECEALLYPISGRYDFNSSALVHMYTHTLNMLNEQPKSRLKYTGNHFKAVIMKQQKSVVKRLIKLDCSILQFN